MLAVKVLVMLLKFYLGWPGFANLRYLLNGLAAYFGFHAS